MIPGEIIALLKKKKKALQFELNENPAFLFYNGTENGKAFYLKTKNRPRQPLFESEVQIFLLTEKFKNPQNYKIVRLIKPTIKKK